MLDLEVQYIRGCPHHVPLLDMVKDILRSTGIDGTVREREICDDEQARVAGFRGSPTLLINGLDLEPNKDPGEQPSISCRMYGDKGLPAREIVEAAMLRSKE